MNAAHQAFGLTLKAHREQQGIPLSAIADTTKIGIALLSALERGDLSRWPKGIFRRAFFREYVAALSLSPEPLLAELARLFPDETAPRVSEHGTEALRLTLAGETRTSAVNATRRFAVAAGELALVAAVGAAFGWLLSAGILTTIGVAALLYYPASNLLVDRAWAVGRAQLRGVVNIASPVRSSAASGSAEAEHYEPAYDDIEGREELQPV